jgi:hypothetical protein
VRDIMLKYELRVIKKKNNNYERDIEKDMNVT